MKRFLILILFVCLSQICVKGVTYVKKINQISNDLKRAPYKGSTVTFSYDSNLKTLSMWFHYEAEQAEIIITKEGEVVADDVFDMAANETLECDMSDCNEGEYVVCVQIDGEVFFTTVVL